MTSGEREVTFEDGPAGICAARGGVVSGGGRNFSDRSASMKKRTIGGFVAAAVTALLLAVPAFAASPGQIYKDYADNGTLDGNYSASDLQRALKDASVQGYGSPVVIIKIKQKPKPGGVGGQKTPPSGTTPVPRKGGLPFTGAQLGLFTVIGLALIGSGALLRLTGRKKSGH
jgi:hypothetical protein